MFIKVLSYFLVFITLIMKIAYAITQTITTIIPAVVLNRSSKTFSPPEILVDTEIPV